MRSNGKIFLIVMFFGLIASLVLVSCSDYHYEGEDISSIEYISVKYNGGYINETKVDLLNGQVLSRGYFQGDNIPEEYSIDYDFDLDSVDSLIDEIGSAGLFDLNADYPSPGDILDGSGWTLKINYADGTSKISTGDNNYPTDVFQKADYGFYNLYGNDLFGTIQTAK